MSSKIMIQMPVLFPVKGISAGPDHGSSPCYTPSQRGSVQFQTVFKSCVIPSQRGLVSSKITIQIPALFPVKGISAGLDHGSSPCYTPSRRGSVQFQTVFKSCAIPSQRGLVQDQTTTQVFSPCSFPSQMGIQCNPSQTMIQVVSWVLLYSQSKGISAVPTQDSSPCPILSQKGLVQSQTIIQIFCGA